MEYLKLLGILLIVVGFALKIDTTAVVIFSAIITALLSGISPMDALSLLGKSFTDNRMVTLYFLTLPMIGLVESHGLKQVAVNAVTKLKKATPSTILNAYLFIRELGGLFGIALSGQVTFIRPLVTPMVTASAEKKHPLTDEEKDLIKARAAATENLGNFFAQNLFVASGGVLLIASTMDNLKYHVNPITIVMYSAPIAIITFIITAIYNKYFDKKFESEAK